jgi:N-acetylmuramoyl-L-alanine amidase
MKVKYLVIHCTATPEGRAVTSETIRHWHTDPPPAGRGWKQVGYTDIIHLDGNVERFAKNNDDGNVDPWEITNGAVGINAVSRHIVYIGGVAKNGKTAKDTRTAAQLDAMAYFVKDFLKKYPWVKVAGHNQFAAKACPSFNVPRWLVSIGVNPINIYGSL